MNCRGFWNMCACESCRARDRDLETQISDPEKRKVAVREFLEARAITIDENGQITKADSQ